MKRLCYIIVALLSLSGCGIYSFSGTSIQPDVNTITLPTFEYRAMKVNPTLSNNLSEEIRKRFRQMTRLEQTEMDGDLQISGAITGYEVRAQAITANEMAARSRLTVTVSVDFINRKHPEESFDKKSFSAYADYDSTNSLDAVEQDLCVEIVEKLVEDIFNATVAQW